MVNRSNKLLGLIKRTFKALDKESFLILYKSLIRSILDYGGSVYYPSTKKNIQLIENIQRHATRILPELRGLTYSERLESLKLPTLFYRRKRYDLIQLYKIVHGFEDVKPEKFFEFNDNCTRGHLFKIQKLSFSIYCLALAFEHYRQVYIVHSGLQDESLQVTISKLP